MRSTPRVLRNAISNVVTHRGLVLVQDATLFTRPPEPPLVIGAAMTPETARWLGGWADGLITAGAQHDTLQKTVEAFREGGGDGKPMFLQAAVSYGATDDEAAAAARQRWGHSVVGLEKLADLPTPRAFDSETGAVSLDQIHKALRCSGDVNRHIEWLQGDFDLGFTTVYLHYVGDAMERFIDLCAERILPAVSSR